MSRCRQCGNAGYVPSGTGIVECRACKFKTSESKIFLVEVLGSFPGAGAFFGGMAALRFYVFKVHTPGQFIVAGIVTVVVCGPLLYKNLM